MPDRIGQQLGNFLLIRSTPREYPFHNLPAQLTPLIGREQEVDAASVLLQRPEVRLVTFTGAGGIGKTRLSLQVASSLIATFADGICFVPLASISDPALVVPAITQMLGIKEAGERSLVDLLKDYLRDKHLLLLLDNFEQVVTAAPILSDLLITCPFLKILVTSRAVLHIQGEYEFPVPPLALPKLTHLPESEALSQYAAVALFLQRAQAVRPDFALTPANAQAIAEICVHLDGLPLAIELAAVRIKLLPPQVLLQRLTHRMQLLTSPAQNVPARQQTLRSTIGWSYHLLDAAEQKLFQRLSVFVGGCTLRAIEFIYSALEHSEVQVLDALASLIDKSLLQRVEQEDEPRFGMLETIREYALERLAASRELEATWHAHALYYLQLAEEAETKYGGPEQTTWLELLEREYENLRAAMQWSLGRGETEASGRDHREIALRLGGALRRFWVVRGYISEARTFLEEALADSEGIAASIRAKALVTAATLAVIQSDYDRAETLGEESLALFRALGDRPGIAFSLYLLSVTPGDKGNAVAKRALAEEALALSREMGDKERVAWSLFTVAFFDGNQGEYARARTLLEESLTMQRELGNKRGIASSLLRLAQVLFVSNGDQMVVLTHLQEALALFREIGDKEGIASSFSLSGQLALTQGDVATARSLLEQSMKLYREVGFRWGVAETLSFLARVLAFQGDGKAAWNLYEESLGIAREVGHTSLIPSCLEGLASMLVLQSQQKESLEDIRGAAILWGAAEFLRESIGIPIPPIERANYDHSVVTARARLGERTFTSLWAEGRSLTPEQALSKVSGKGLQPIAVPTSPTYPAGLTAREVEILRLVASGLTNAQIAQELNLSEKTIANHLTHIFNKTTSDNRAAAAAFAMRHGLV